MNSETSFDAFVLGTGLVESITAAALAKAGFKIAHLDVNQYYGGDHASLTADELVAWAEARDSTSPNLTSERRSAYISAQRAHFTSPTYTPELPSQSRRYSLSLMPALIPAVGPFISSLVASGVAKYGSYRLLERVGIFDGEKQELRPVPASKEDIFKSSDLSLIDKRRLMRFLTFTASEFEEKSELSGKEQEPFVNFLTSEFKLGKHIAHAVAYAIAFCPFADEPTMSALTRMRTFIRSTGRYGPSPFLVGHYGGLGEIAQGFCRTAAVSGAVYILGQSTISISAPSLETGNKYSLLIDDVPDPLTADVILTAADLSPESAALAASSIPASLPVPSRDIMATARCIIVLDCPMPFPAVSPSSNELEETSARDQEDRSPAVVDTAVAVFPPGTVIDGSETVAAVAFMTGQGTMSAPTGKYVLYISMSTERDANPKEALEPYLNALMTCYPKDTSPNREFEVFYTENPPFRYSSAAEAIPSDATPRALFQVPALSTGLAVLPDAAAEAAEKLFFDITQKLRDIHPEWRDDGIEGAAVGHVPVDVGEARQGSGGDAFAELKFWPPLLRDEDEEAAW